MHLVWDWNGTLLNDLDLVVRATNDAFLSAAGPPITADEHRLLFRRPIADFYAEVLGRLVDDEEFARLDKVFHDAYRAGLTDCALVDDALTALQSWPGTQSLLSMWFHDDLVPTIEHHGLTTHFVRVDGMPLTDAGVQRFKAEYLARHLAELRVEPSETVLIGDSIDDAEAARSVGAACVLYTGGFTHPDRLRESGHPTAETLTNAVKLARTLV